MSLDAKYEYLQSLLRELGATVVAYSGGVDSSLLLKVGTDTLGERCWGLLGVSPSLAETEYRDAVALAAQIGARLKVVQTHELDNPNYASNPTNRCYHCKTELYDRLVEWRRAEGVEWICDGTNLDDEGDWRPGLQAAREHGVRSPLREAELTKAELRALSQRLGLPTWDKPALACLSSRFPYGTDITPERLRMVDRAEEAVRARGVRQLRVRHHRDVTGADLARLEIDPAEVGQLLDAATLRSLGEELRGLGYRHVTLDLLGYRHGSANEGLAKESSAVIALETIA